jgi:hypothetical protein
MGRVRFAAVALLAVACFSCRPGATVAARSGHAGENTSSGAPSLESSRLVGPARLIPDVTSTSGGSVEILPDGTRRLIAAGLRIVDHPDGSIERARDVLSGTNPRAVELPTRLGGGFLIFSGSGTTSLLWRTKGWLDRLQPLAEVRGQVVDIIPGFDRLYARLENGDFKALDPQSGQQLPLDPLPRATRIGLMAYADAWRAVAVVDYRGALATFDAGASWRSVPLPGRGVSDLWLRDGEFVLQSQRERWLLDATGELSAEETPAESPRLPSVVREASSRRADVAALSDGTVGTRRPLVAAVQDGWPAADGESAILARAGSLFRVELSRGAIVEWRADAFRPDDASCHAVSLGETFGFVCASQTGATAVYSFEPPFGVREVMRFDIPREVVASGNGALVVRGSCARDAKSTDASTFCYWWWWGQERELQYIPTRRGRGEARPVALRDGRAALVVAPDETSAATLLLSRGGDWAPAVPLHASNDDALLRGASWLDGLEEREPGVVSGWALSGRELHGVRVRLDGTIEVGRKGARVEQTTVAGRFALDWGAAGRGAETVDGGLTWKPVDFAASDQLQPTPAGCGPVGCTRQGWMRVGWGSGTEPDLVPAPPPKPSRVVLVPARGVSLRCELTGEMSSLVSSRRAGEASGGASGAAPPPPLNPFPLVFLPSPVGARMPPLSAGPKPANPSTPFSAWTPFHGSQPPPLRSGDIGLESGTDTTVTMHGRIYAWGPRSPEWARSAQVQARFDDRFELFGVRSTTPTTSFWADDERAADALGLVSAHTVNWGALLDPTGQAALLYAQQGSGRADLYGAAQGEALSEWRSADGSPLPVPTSVVRLGPTWFFLAPANTAGAAALLVYRVDGGVARRLARLPRTAVPGGEYAPKLTRRTGAEGALGVLVQGAPGFGQVIRDWYVMPLDPASGELGEPVRLLGSDLEGRVPARCASDVDAWFVNTELSLSPAIQVVGPPLATLSAIELRLGLSPSAACIVSMAARAEGLPSALPNGARTPAAATGLSLPLVATDNTSGRRWLLRCGAP